MEIAKLMTHPVDVVKMDDSLAHVKNLFELRSFHHLAVVENGQLVGVVSDRDLLKAVSPNLDSPSETMKDLLTLNKRVHQIMTRDLITINVEQGMFHAIRLFNRHNISCLPVVNEQEKLIGMLSWRDILRFIEKKKFKVDFIKKHLIEI